MKKLLFLFATVGVFSFTSCEGPEGPQGPAGTNIEAPVIELNTVNFGFSSEFGWNIYHTFSQFGVTPLDSDSVLMYRLSGTIDSQTPIWQPIPRTIYFSDSSDELDYDFDFSPVDFSIYAGGNYDISTTPDYLNGQTFRIVVIPGYFANRMAIDYSDYNAVAKAYHIDESKVIRQ